MSWFGSDAALIFEESNITDVVVTIFDAPMLPDSVADGCGGQGDLAGIEGDVAGLPPKARLGIFVPGMTGDADGSLDDVFPVGSKPPGNLEGFDETMLMSAMALLLDGQGTVERLAGGRDRFDVIEQALLIDLDLSDQEIAAFSGRLKGFFDNAWRRQ